MKKCQLNEITMIFVRSGMLAIGSSIIWGIGSYGGVWTARASNSDTFAYLVNFSLDTINPSNNNHRYYGRSLRCLSTAIDM